MKNKQITFKNIDRIIRLIYREIPLSEHVRNTDFSLAAISESFDLEDELFRERIKNAYLQVYAKNYHRDDLEYLLDWLSEELKREFSSTNALFLFSYISEKIISQQGKELFVEFEDLLEWDGFINKVDMKLFMSAYFANQELDRSAWEYSNTAMRHNNKNLQHILNRTGISENHMHFKASGYIEEINWYGFLKLPIFDERSKLEAFCDTFGIFRNVPKTEKNRAVQVNFLMQVKLIRCLLTAMKDRKYDHLAEFFTIDKLEILLCSTDLEIAAHAYIDANLLNEIQEEELAEFAAFRKKEKLFSYGYREIDFLTALFKQALDQENQVMLYLFNLYICGSCEVKFQFVQDNNGMGFSKFKEKEDNKDWFVTGKLSKSDMTQSVFSRYYNERNVGKVEFRIAPKEDKQEYVAYLLDLEKKNIEEWKVAQAKDPSVDRLKYAVIVHFIKPHKKKFEEPTFFPRYDEQRKEVERRVDSLMETNRYIQEIIAHHSLKPYEAAEIEEDLLDQSELFAGLENKLISIDTANYELNNPPEIYACSFRKYKDKVYNPYGAQFTYHVGEEFNTLSTGLRAIDEVLRFMAYRKNDRLGHALALGIDAEHYYKQKRENIFTTLQDYIDDVVWMYHLLEHSSLCETKLILFLQGQYDRFKYQLFEKVTKDIPTLEDYIQSYLLRGDDPEIYLEHIDKDYLDYDRLAKRLTFRLNSLDDKHQAAFNNFNARKLYYHYHYDPVLKENGNKKITVDVDPLFTECIQLVQQILKQKILKIGVFIEANPSSNKKISYLNQYSSLPAVNLNQYGLTCEKDFLHLPISINTDDSSIFQTNLNNEYALLAAALIRDGCSELEVYDYIEHLAIASNVHSFIE